MCANRQLNSAKPEQIDPSDQSGSKETDKAKGAHVEFCLEKFGVQMIGAVTFTACFS